MDLDTEAGLARYGVAQPRTLELPAIGQAVAGAGYTLKSVDIELTGVVQEARCETCDADVVQLLADGTQQIFELEFEQQPAPVGDRVRLTATTQVPADSHPRWVALSWSQP